MDKFIFIDKSFTEPIIPNYTGLINKVLNFDYDTTGNAPKKFIVKITLVFEEMYSNKKHNVFTGEFKYKTLSKNITNDSIYEVIKFSLTELITELKKKENVSDIQPIDQSEMKSDLDKICFSLNH